MPRYLQSIQVTRRKIRYSAIALVALMTVGYLVAPAVQARMSWYYVAGQYDSRNLLVTCEAETPIFRTTGFNFGFAPKEPILSSIEVYLACKTRDRLFEEGKFNETGLFGQKSALADVVERAAQCLSSTDLTSELISDCRDAHFDAIDWLLAQGVDINAGDLGTVLHYAIHNVDEEMFDFLVSRGADPHFYPPTSPVYAGAEDQLMEFVDTEPKSAVELLELQLATLDDSEFPEVVATLRRMLNTANDGQFN